uniref:WD repeat-containing protein 19 n=1 Tax=Parascaris univalens TaxID=6257 RepID=A0A915BKF7_PARUN
MENRLLRWLNAWRICDFTKSKEHWRKYAFAAMQNADVELAIRVLKQIDDVALVWALEEVQFIEERNLLAGHLALIMEQYDIAESHFLRSTKPIEALDMRRDLLHWEKALQLANRLAPQEIPYISKEYAQQLEFTGEYSAALTHYENGIIDNYETDAEEILDHNEICRSGIARMSIRAGDIRRGIKMASELDGRAVKKDCALILEQMKQYGDAALLYELGHFYDRAAAVCLKAKNWTKVGDLLPKVRSPKIQAQYGKVMEGEKKYKQAALAYKNARDYDNVVRILLDYLDMPEEAVRVVKESRSVEGAKLVAKFFGKLGDQASAIEFLVLSQCHQEAFQLAESEQKMDVYADAIDENGTVEQFAQLADYFAARKNYSSAGKYHYKAAHYEKALDFLLLNGEDPEALKTAIECVADARDPELSRRLTDFLMGESDGIPKDAKFLFRYYVAMQMNREAAKTAIIIAREEQARGCYRIAHQLLFGMYQELIQKGIKVPSEMENNLMLLHSYLIVKGLVKRGEHMKASRMLIRVANNISRFPAHVVPILTSAVIECSKAGLKSSAFNYAAQLLKPENRKKVEEKYRKRIEAIVRKSDRTADEGDKKSACPYCNNLTEESELVCNSCKNLIPYC